MRLRDVMSVGVVAVPSRTTVKEAAGLMVGAKVSGLPVVDDGLLVGIVTESDLQPVHEGAPGRRVQTVGDLMTRKVVTLVEDMTVTSAARVLERHGVKRAPVMRGDRLVGIISRCDLLRPYLRTDSEILAEVEEAVIAGIGERASRIDPVVEEGVVTLAGEVVSERARSILVRLARGVDGVVDVEDHLVLPEHRRG